MADTTALVLGTGSLTGTVTAASPHATAVGKWLQAIGGKGDTTFLAFQLTGGASAIVVIQATMDGGTSTHTAHTFGASGEIYTIAVAGGTLYRAVCTAFTSGSPIVVASASGAAEVKVFA